ncbi:G-type lectin S-receptor-like serine/threonine-protein kinase SD2-5 [Vitis riparia]|uniref:G-type lectin S-receptor-like serine/threonine-protein kinase SD2-5 n=1 Tax=Vitis riparia TaxID=96939 RepID=UPI00155A64E7|nr:G-type lectin S-receptor-like serine/threonine-protein kinase SD2-5 [Vitis riparia]
MKLFLFLFLLGVLIQLFAHGSCKSDLPAPSQVMLAVPVGYSVGFKGRAFLMEANQMVPSFRAALSVEAINGKYACSLGVFLGDVKVWDSGHFTRFYTSERCVLELTTDGDLQLKGAKEQVGWRTATFGQGVERLQLSRTGNLVLVDALNRIKWQSFNFPTDVMLWGQKFDLGTSLTSFASNSDSFYSFEIQPNKIALYLNSGSRKHSYWEFKPSKNRNITFVELGTKGLELFNNKHKKIAQILSQRLEPLRFMSLGNGTGNLGLYYYSSDKGKFETSFQALNTTCDLPLACEPYGICTFSNACSCIRFVKKTEERMRSSCDEGHPRGFCGREVEMLELEGVSTVLRNDPKQVNVSREECSSLCMDDCKCVAALYSSGKGGADVRECFLYGLVRGVKQVDRGSGFNYMVKVPKGSGGGHGRTKNVRKWVLVMVGVVDGLIILLVLGGLGYYIIRKRRKNLATDNTT